MKYLTFSIISIIFSFINIQAQSDEICGFWLTEKGDSQVQVFKASNGKFYGKVVWLEKNKDTTDTKNPNKKLRSKKVLGLQILNNSIFNPKSKTWEAGTIYDPESGNTYDCYLWFDKDKNILKLKGYVLGIKFLGRESQWKREPKLRP
jgi:uncharacterized protein (DUF2147 family)